MPSLPTLDPGLLYEHRVSQNELSQLAEATESEVLQIYSMLQVRLVIDGLAHTLPVLVDPDRQMLVPPPRAFLSARHRRRVEGATAVYRYIAARAGMKRAGVVSSVLHHTTPYVFHGMLETLLPSGRESNAGMIRARPTSFVGQSNPFQQPEAAQCEALLTEAMSFAIESAAPAIARAGWLMFTVVTIHPFVDGNGRVSRALALAAATDGNDAGSVLGIDPGMLEQWSLHRGAYIDTIAAGHLDNSWRPDRLDPRPFMEFAVRTSTVGAQLASARLRHLMARMAALGDAGLSSVQAMVLLAVAMLRSARLADFDGLGLDGDAVVTAVEELVEAGLLVWAPRPPSLRALANCEELGLFTTERSRAVLV